MTDQSELNIQQSHVIMLDSTLHVRTTQTLHVNWFDFGTILSEQIQI